MAYTPAIRRSNRIRAHTRKLIASVVLSAQVEKRRSPRLAPLKTVQIQVITQHVPVTRNRTTLSGFIVNDTSSPAIYEEEDEEEDDIESIDASDVSSVASEEHLPLSNDNFEYMAGDSLDRRDSYDSRLESGNEAYMLDDFVVGSEEGDSDWSEAESEITIVQSVSVPDEEDGSEAESEASVSRPRRITRLDSAVSVSSTTSSGSESSGLFVTDGREEIPEEFPFDDYFFRPIESDIEPADVAEEITEAVIRFGRRCNRFAAPICLELTRRFSEDADVIEAIQLAIDRGLCNFKQTRS
ncbi:hypothetical protein BDU57DRAFT_528516 [Ampelomyces quisqualis]|uniref:Uncharacterized protein n=1 Tax=Ampelomyces quisqualis TaxID=50730 RepID=A0A6A5QT50_AMPQU|nr:hypothetical protein BDU57DRAFT_528516 [Ampelomyces quisqualis]